MSRHRASSDGFETRSPGDFFSACAVGNLDGNDAQSTFSSTGIMSERGELQREPLEIIDELE